MAASSSASYEPENASHPGARQSLAAEWPEYLMEAVNLGIFMLAACAFGTLLEHPASQVRHSIDDPLARRAIMGVAMGLTAIGIICSPWGQRSGAHLNPSVTLTYWSLGRVRRWTATFYVAAQFLGGVAGVQLAAWLIGPPLGHHAVNYVVTSPGETGLAAAFVAELSISLFMMLTVLFLSNTPRLTHFTPWAAGLLVAIYITFEAPFSGMSMNPARSFGSAFAAADGSALWIYCLAPPLGMVLAGLLYRLRRSAHHVFCAKLHHHNTQRCIFRCGYAELHDSR